MHYKTSVQQQRRCSTDPFVSEPRLRRKRGEQYAARITRRGYMRSLVYVYTYIWRRAIMPIFVSPPSSLSLSIYIYMRRSSLYRRRRRRTSRVVFPSPSPHIYCTDERRRDEQELELRSHARACKMKFLECDGTVLGGDVGDYLRSFSLCVVRVGCPRRFSYTRCEFDSFSES